MINNNDNNKTFNEIKEKLEKVAPNLAQKYDLDFLVIYGSYARGKARENSDIDVGVKGHVDFEQNLKLTGELSDSLNMDFIDVVDLNKASPLLAHTATREAVIIFERQTGVFAEFRTEAFKKFVETRRLRDLNFKRTMIYIKKHSVSYS